MQFLDLTGLRELWSKIKAGDAAARTTVAGSGSGNAPIIVATPVESSVAGTTVKQLAYTLSLQNVVSPTDLQTAKQELYGGSIPADDPLTLSDLDERVDNLESGSIVNVVKQATAEDGYAATYVITQGVDSNNDPIQRGVKINIPKDFLVRSAKLKVATASDNIQDVATGEKYIDFVINTPGDDATAAHVYLPINDLVDTYTGENGVAVDSDTNKISAVKDPTSEEFLTIGQNGIKVSGVQSAINAAKTELKGASTDASSAETIAGAKKYADEAVDAVAGNYATAAQGLKANSALQSVSNGTDGSYVTTTIGNKTNNDQTIGVAVTTATVENSGTTDGLAVASDVKSYVDTAVAAKNVFASGETGTSALVKASASNNAVTVGSTAKLQAAVASAESAIQGVQVNSADLTPDANKKVNISIAEGTTNGTIAVNGSDVAVHGLGSMAYANTGDYATSAQGAAADSALQSISNGTDGDYIDVTVTPKGNGTTQEVSATVTVQPIASSSASAKGLVEASDAKAYIDGKFTNLGEITKTASGTAQNGGVFVVNQVVEENGALKSVGSLEVEQAGASAAAEARLRGATDAAGYVANDTLAALRNEINSITGGSGSIATQIQTAIEGLDSSITASASRNAFEAEPDTAVFTTVSIVDGELDQATSAAVLIGGIPIETLTTILS